MLQFGCLEQTLNCHHPYKVCLSCELWFGSSLWGQLSSSLSTFKSLFCAVFTVGSLHELCFFVHPSFPSSVTYFVLKLCSPVFQQVNQEQSPTPGTLEAADILHCAQKLQCTWQPAGKAQHKEEKTRLKLTEGSPWEMSVGTISTVLVLADRIKRKNPHIT